MSGNDDSIIDYIKLLKDHELKYKEKIKPNKISKIDKVLFSSLVSLVFISFIFIGVYAIFKPDYRFLLNISIVLISFSYVLLLLMPIVKVFEERKTIKHFFTMPLSSSIDQNIKRESLIDNDFLPRFISLGKELLELGLMEVRHEREFLNKRITLLVGPIDKLGILPGIISMIITISKPVGGYDWVMGLAYGYIALIVISLSFFNLLVKYDRIIALTELALSRCESRD
ncbi:hypothetical protein HGT73_01260 [Rosenbergiella australiborealis]|uniref:MotA/TolQ/ExbB proton channel domain-containing protein n=1 Tax=Rosenbergiella australiborealis TaxID=1544696 RepID=A0ABS5T105_9GAMM|nr:hypothetical protein [Rosenbergiella australiborealis]MBT0726021.1 hypothetical protein [Rosenbergiella australiborealis]